MPSGAMWGVQDRVQAENVAKPGVHELLEFMVKCFWVSRLRLNWLIQSKKNGEFVRSGEWQGPGGGEAGRSRGECNNKS